jgi:hypothetical protein
VTDDHETNRPAYDPSSPAPPDREPPLRNTAPQSNYTMGQVGLGFAVLLVGVALTFGLAVLLA